MRRVVHVVGTGTIGEPLIGLLVDHREAFGIDEVTFHKRTPTVEERAKIADLMRRGAMLAVDDDRREDFAALGLHPTLGGAEALAQATVVIDSTPAGNKSKEQCYAALEGPVGFLAQGSEYGFGKMYARGHQRRGPGAGRGPLPARRVVQHPQHLGAGEGHRFRERRLAPDGRPLRVHAAVQRHQPGRGVQPQPHGGPPRRPPLRHPPRPRRPRGVRHPGPRPAAVVLGHRAEHAVHARAALQPHPGPRHHRRRGRGSPGGQQPGGPHPQALRQPGVLLRAGPRLLRADPEPDGGAHPDHRGARPAHRGGLLLHPAGRQLPAVVGGRHALVPVPGGVRGPHRRAAAATCSARCERRAGAASAQSL